MMMENHTDSMNSARARAICRGLLRWLSTTGEADSHDSSAVTPEGRTSDLPGTYIPSEDELQSSGGDFAMMPEDLYVVEVIERKVKDLDTPGTVEQPNPYNKTEDFPGGVPRPVLNVVMKAISFANGDELVDENGDFPKNDVLFFSFLDTTKVGLKPRPSNFRKFITAAFGQKPETSVNIDDWAELVGKRLIVVIKHNNGKHKVDDYQPIRTRRKAAASTAKATDDAAAPADVPATDETVSDKAKELFGDDVSF